MTARPMPAAPAHIAPYVRALGVDGAVTFLMAFGGAAGYLAGSPQERGRVVQVIGEAGLAALTAEVGLGRVDRIPKCGKWVAQVLWARGMAVSEIARQLHSTDKTVRVWIRALGTAEERQRVRQLDLFEPAGVLPMDASHARADIPAIADGARSGGIGAGFAAPVKGR